MIIFEGGLQMTLLTYAPITNVPAGVCLKSAGDYLPWETFQKLLKLKDNAARPLQVLADFVLGLWVFSAKKKTVSTPFSVAPIFVYHIYIYIFLCA